MDKRDQVKNSIDKLKSVMRLNLQKGKYERCMASISVGCQILYEYNQYYMDSDFEDGVVQIANCIRNNYQNELNSFCKEQKTVLFYDGFGLDTRGVAKMYLNALWKNGYKIIYVTGQSSKGCMPETDVILHNAEAAVYYIDFKKNYMLWVKELLDVVFQTHPRAMFYYTTPYDVSGAVAFAVMDGMTDRFLIDLTDHAFWLGVNSNDYFCGSREMSASNQYYERRIAKEKLIKLGVNLIVDDGGPNHDELPFDVTKNRYIFSGGALYKTLGDRENTYYSIVRHILESHDDIYFLYAGDGDRTEMNKILEQFPQRAFLIPERKDFYYLIRNCTLYLNTYPMFGGMMMKYSANAGKIPITLKHENDSDGLLLEQDKRKIEYLSYQELIDDVDMLLNNLDYLTEREKLLQGSVISEERFIKNVKSTIEKHCTDYHHCFERIDTEKFKREFLERFDFEATKAMVSKLINKSLYCDFIWMPVIIAKRKVNKLIRKQPN